MNTSQKLAIVALPLVAGTMLPVFRLAGTWLGSEWGWYAGFLVYWPVWCLLFPTIVIGPRAVLDLFRRRPMSPTAWTLVALPPVRSLVGRFSMGERTNAVILWVVMSVINGTLEEVLWRGVFAKLFPASILWGVLWPAAWFAMWHFAPGMLSMGDRVWILVVGAAFLGLAMGWVAHSTQSIRWTVVSHALAGIFRA